jgi:hypothetical protein
MATIRRWAVDWRQQAMVLSAEEAQRFLDNSRLDGTAIGGFEIGGVKRTEGGTRFRAPIGLMVGGYVVNRFFGPRATLDFFASAGPDAHNALPSHTTSHLVIVTADLGVAVAKTLQDSTRVLSWLVRPEEGFQFELDPLEVHRGRGSVGIAIGEYACFAGGPSRDAAFRLFPRQPERWSATDGRPRPSR